MRKRLTVRITTVRRRTIVGPVPGDAPESAGVSPASIPDSNRCRQDARAPESAGETPDVFHRRRGKP